MFADPPIHLRAKFMASLARDAGGSLIRRAIFGNTFGAWLVGKRWGCPFDEKGAINFGH